MGTKLRQRLLANTRENTVDERVLTATSYVKNGGGKIYSFECDENCIKKSKEWRRHVDQSNAVA